MKKQLLNEVINNNNIEQYSISLIDYKITLTLRKCYSVEIIIGNLFQIQWDFIQERRRICYISKY